MSLKDFKFDIHSGPVIIAFILIVVYTILSIFSGFSAVSGRFISLLTAFTKNWNMVFTLLPLYLGWFIADYYQERRSTDLGNAMSNGFMGLWAGVDWMRNSYIAYQTSSNLFFLAFKVLLCIGMLFYAFFIMRKAARGEKIAMYIGKIREISYVAIIFTPIIYDEVPFDGITLIAAILFFPVIYGIAEFVDYYILPAPKIELIKEGTEKI